MNIIRNVDQEIITNIIKDMVRREDEDSLAIIAEVLICCKPLIEITMRNMSNNHPKGIRDILSMMSYD